LLPLLCKHIVVDEVSLAGLRLNLVRHKDGKTNFDDLMRHVQPKAASEPTPDKGGQKSPLNLAVAGVDLTDAAILWKDEQAGAEYAVTKLNLSTGTLGGSSPAKFSMSLHLKGTPPALDLDFSASGKLLADVEKNVFRGTGLQAKVAGSAATIQGLAVALSGDVEVEPDKGAARLAEFKFSASGAQDKNRFDVKVSLSKADATHSEVGVNDLLVTGTGEYEGIALTEANVKAASISAGLLENDRKIQIYGLTSTFKGKKQDDAFEAGIEVPRLDLSKGKLSSEATTAKAHVQGKDRTADATLKISEMAGSGSLWKLGELALTVDAKQGTDTLKGTLKTPVTVNVDGQSFQLSKIASQFTVESSKLPQKSVSLPLSGDLGADLHKETFAANLSTKFDDSTIKLKVALANFKQPVANVEFSIDKLNLDRYFPPADNKKAAPATAAAPAGPEQPIDLSALKLGSGSALIRIGDLTVQRLKIANLSVDARLQAGRLEVSPFAAALYQGSVGGTATVDANANTFAVKQNMVGVALGPLLQDYMQKDLVEGKGNVMLNVTAQGALPSAIRKSLNGTAKVDLKNGALKGIDLDEVLRNPKELLAKKEDGERTADKGKKTSFAELAASFDIKNGVAHNEDLVARTQVLKLSGAGDLNIGEGSLDYLAKATVSGTKGGDAKSFTVPVRISGTFDAMKYKIDLNAVVSEAVKQEVDKKKTEIQTKIKDKLKGLLKK
jgi:AsmA protein